MDQDKLERIAREALNEEVVEPKTYELGYLLSPFTPADAVNETVDKQLKAPILEAQGEFLAVQAAPKQISLAFPIRRFFDNQRTIFREAIFGSLRFRLNPEAVQDLERPWRNNRHLVRHLLVEISPTELSREKRLLEQERRIPQAMDSDVISTPEVNPKSSVAKAEKATADPAAMDQKIEELLKV